MYEQFRNDFLYMISYLPPQDARGILQALDKVAEKYDIKRKELSLIVYGEELPEIVKMYLVVKKISGLSDATLNNYKIILQLFFRHVKKPVEQITANDIRIFLYAYHKERCVSLRTLDKYREYISRFFSWAYNEGYIQCNPAHNIEPIKHGEHPREALTQVELEYLRMACTTIRERAIVEFMYSTGCRVSELSVIKRSDINWDEKSVHLFGKGRKYRTSFLNAKAEVALKEYLSSRDDDCEFLFASIRKPYRQLQKEAIEKIVRQIAMRMTNSNKKHITPHVLRHTTATTALHGGMPIADISRLLGHESVETTMIYAKTSLEDVRVGHSKYIV